jgi:hypothetical protein
MRILITGSAGIDIKRSSFTHHVGTIIERAFVARSVAGGRDCAHGDVAQAACRHA